MGGAPDGADREASLSMSGTPPGVRSLEASLCMGGATVKVCCLETSPGMGGAPQGADRETAQHERNTTCVFVCTAPPGVVFENAAAVVVEAGAAVAVA